jgi:hypothetical protein
LIAFKALPQSYALIKEPTLHPVRNVVPRNLKGQLLSNIPVKTLSLTHSLEVSFSPN